MKQDTTSTHIMITVTNEYLDPDLLQVVATSHNENETDLVWMRKVDEDGLLFFIRDLLSQAKRAGLTGTIDSHQPQHLLVIGKVYTQLTIFRADEKNR